MIKVIIGANYGDEGKGLMTDYFASQLKKCLVIRFNGGSQASHTVVTPDGKRHAFSHFGAGVFAGAPTYLSRFFIVNPVTFWNEVNVLLSLPKLLIDVDCLVTTPYDMMLNQYMEISRGTNRHGSCGLGINETVVRNEVIPLVFGDLYNNDKLIGKLNVIRHYYVEKRLKELEIKITSTFKKDLENNNILNNYIEDVKAMKNNIFLISKDNIHEILAQCENIIFEGAQGLLLDQFGRDIPYVTTSNTGIVNVVDLLNDFKLQKKLVEIVYVTRAYMTRHGNGPFLTEEKINADIEDPTNVPNQFQGSMRYGLLDLEDLAERINKDLIVAKNLAYEPSIAVTCLDQLNGVADYYVGSLKMKDNIYNFINDMVDKVRVPVGYRSFGNTRSHIRRI